jgi:uncharacterized membrane protein (DUF485 family)
MKPYTPIPRKDRIKKRKRLAFIKKLWVLMLVVGISFIIYSAYFQTRVDNETNLKEVSE